MIRRADRGEIERIMMARWRTRREWAHQRPLTSTMGRANLFFFAKQFH